MKKLTVVLMLLAFSFGTAFGATPKGWTADFAAAQKKAAAEKKLMYVLFTGSDWCPYCIQLKKNVLDKADFKKLAAQSLVLVYIDFPHKSKADKPEQNRKLQRKYGIRVYPTALLMDAEGNVLQPVRSRNLEACLNELQTAIGNNNGE